MFVRFTFLFFLASCAHKKLDSFYSDPFQIAGFSQNLDQSITEATFYIEGDGRSFVMGRLNSNPTPSSMEFMKLAMEDKKMNVFYLARPCQFLINQEICSGGFFWSSGQFNEVVVNSYTQLIKSFNFDKINLVGFSGGGGLAVLIASRIQNLKNLILIAPNLDHVKFTQYHKVVPLSESLNPIDFAKNITAKKIIYFIGKNDKIIPLEIVQNFISKFGGELFVIKSASHNIGWRIYVQNHIKSM